MSRWLLVFALAAGILGAQVGVTFPTEPAPPVVVPFEPGGDEVHLHTRENDSKPFPPHRIIGNVYYVGLADYAAYLITTDEGHILIDSTFESTVPQIRKNVEELGFRFPDIKILLLSHAHGDHGEGMALVKELTAARLYVMEGDAEAMEAGDRMPAVKVDRVLHDKDVTRLGGVAITSYRTPGHTRGNTTHTWQVEQDGRTYDVVLLSSLTTQSAPLKDNPELMDEFVALFRFAKTLPCDVFLSPHGKMLGLTSKYAKLQQGGPNPYIDPEGFRAHVKLMEQSFYYKLDWAQR